MIEFKRLYCGACAKYFSVSEVLFKKSSSTLENPSCPYCEDLISLSALELPYKFIQRTTERAREILQEECLALGRSEKDFSIEFIHVFSKEEISGSIVIWDRKVSADFTSEEFDRKNYEANKYFPYYRTLIGNELELMNFPYPAIYTYVEVKSGRIKKRPVIDLSLN